jgi:hypothetical protein
MRGDAMRCEVGDGVNDEALLCVGVAEISKRLWRGKGVRIT